MAIIKTPGVGISPYQTSDADPTVLRAGANGATVLAAAATADTGANTSVYVAGQAALNSLITSNQPGVFQGANVNITLEEQNFNTTNQVTSTTNYAAGAAGSIQYNNGANGFAGDAYFTYTNSNIITPGIRTDSYLYANGAPFLAGGNAAIGNFVFTGDTMSISDDANISLTIQGNSLGNNLNQIIINPTSVDLYAFNNSPYSFSELYLDNGNTEAPYAQIIVDGNSTPQQTWTFAADGNLTLPGNAFAVNYANGDPVVISGGAAGLPLANGTSNIDIATANGNVTITANGSPTWTFESDGNLTLPTAGNIVGAVNIIGNGTGNVNVIANSRAWTFAADGNLVLPLAGNIVNYGNTWNFGYNGTTQFPGNLLHPPAGNPLDIQVTVGNAYSTVSLYETGSQLIIQDNTTGPNPAWALFEADLANVNTPQAVVILKPGDTGNEVRWYFDALGNLTLPGNIIAINYANGNRVTGNVTFSSEIVIGTGTSNLISGLYLAPSSSSADANMYLRVRGNINDEPTHIHFDTGNNQYYNQFIGDDNKYIQLANTGNIVINSNDNAGNAAQWTFAADGNLNLPNGAVINDTVGNAVAFGRDAAATGPQGNAAVAIGQQAGETSQGASSVAIGYQAGLNTQGANAVAIGTTAGNSAQGDNSVAIGTQAGQITQGQFAVAIGDNAGNNAQGTDAVAIGASAGLNTQGNGAVAFGQGTGETSQGNNAVALGKAAGQINQGINSIAIGQSAGLTNQGNNSIVLNATGSALDQTTANTFTVKPIRNASTGNVLYYDETSGEITFNVGSGLPLANGTSNIDIATANGNVTITANGSPTWTFGTDGNLTTPGVSGNITGANVISANAFTNLTGAGNVLIASSENQTGPVATWTFDPVSDGTGNMIFPTGMHISTDGFGGTRLSQNSNGTPTALRLIAGNVDGYAVTGWSEEETPGAGNLAVVSYNLSTNPSNVAIITGNLSATSYTWTFANGGNLTLPNGAVIKDTAGNAVAFGKTAGNTGQGISSVAIGYGAGLTNQGNQSVAIGENAGSNQGSTAVAIGQNAGGSVALQGDDAVAIGHSAGANTQGTQSVAIGLYAGETTQGIQSVAIGSYAGQSAQGNNSIIINATGVGLNAATANTFTVAPVRNDVANIAEVMCYNTTSKEITYGNTISVAGNITGNYFLGNGSALTGIAASVPSQTILPTIQTITVAATSGVGNAGGGGSAFANVTVSNVTPVTEYGVIITSGTSSQKYATGALGSIPGTVQLSFTTGLNSTPFTVYAYVTSNAGTYYSNAATGTSGICLLAGTQIALSDGTHKAIEDITYTDKLLSWDFDRGCYAETLALWIKRGETGSQYNLLTFSDGTTLRTFDQHRIFNKQAGAFTYPMTAATPIGTVTVNEHGQEITLTNKQVIQDTIEYYNVITNYHMNLFSDSVLTSCRFNNIYPIVDMKFVKDDRTLRTRAEFENVEDRFFHGLRLAEQTADIETVEWYVDRLLATEVSTQSELAF